MSKHKLAFVGSLLFVLSFALATRCSAGLVVNALSAWNDDNDKLTDYSWSVPVDDGSAVIGLARIDRIQTGIHKEFDFTASKQVWLAFAVSVSGPVTSQDPYGSIFLNWMKHGYPTNSSYQLSTLLNDSSIPAQTMVLLLELKATPDVQNYPNLAQLEDGKYASQVGSSIQSAFSEIVSIGFSWVGAFGIGNSTLDFFYLEPLGATLGATRDEVFGLSLLAAGSGVNPLDFKPLFALADDTYGIDETKYQLASLDVVTVYVKTDSDGKPIEFKDSGIAGVNYVPEPASLTGLVGLALIGMGGYCVRWRKS